MNAYLNIEKFVKNIDFQLFVFNRFIKKNIIHYIFMLSEQHRYIKIILLTVIIKTILTKQRILLELACDIYILYKY